MFSNSAARCRSASLAGGVVFAAIGRALGVLDDAMFSAVVLMVIVTTLVAPPWLKRVIRRQGDAASAT